MFFQKSEIFLFPFAEQRQLQSEQKTSCTQLSLNSQVIFYIYNLSIAYHSPASFSPLAVVDLEEKLHRCEADQLNSVQRVRMLEGQLQAVRGELADTLEQLVKLKDILQITQSIADERQASVEKLTDQLRWGYALMGNIFPHTGGQRGTRDDSDAERTSTWCWTDEILSCSKSSVFQMILFTVSKNTKRHTVPLTD